MTTVLSPRQKNRAATEAASFFCDTFSTPIGAFTIAVNETGAVVATTFGDEARLRQNHRGNFVSNPAAVRAAREQVLDYFAGKRREFDLDLAPQGTAFQLSVWEQLRRIPFGETRTYAQIATAVGNPKACRAVGLANGANPIGLIVPCHRVIGANGTLTGFSGGMHIKQILLRHEGVTLA